MFSGTQKPKGPQVLDLQGWNQVHFEEEWSEYRELSLNNLLIWYLIFLIHKVFFLNFFMRSSKKYIKFILEGKWTFGIISYTLSHAKSMEVSILFYL